MLQVGGRNITCLSLTRKLPGPVHYPKASHGTSQKAGPNPKPKHSRSSVKGLPLIAMDFIREKKQTTHGLGQNPG